MDDEGRGAFIHLGSFKVQRIEAQRGGEAQEWVMNSASDILSPERDLVSEA